ncbi:MAG: hypothetical protein JXB00_16755 [Bacteroidales bacterium]|nr:hypothetical protein [Bacteroidales bacterium]
MTEIKLNIKLDMDDNDSSDFIGLVGTIINSLIQIHDIELVNVVKIDNWFDHKWLNYSGKGIIHFEETLHPDKVALTNFWKDKITVPPFHPNRVKSDRLYRTKDTLDKQIEKPIHTIKGSSDNLNNRIEGKIENGLFVWFSANSENNQKGSLMIYKVDKADVESWYASIENNDGWTITKTKGINRDLINGMIKQNVR